jgi:glycosyltransferase involved in cell wall biosynthesis
MINHRNIIVFSDDWGRYPSTLQHIGKHLAINNRIIWIGSLGLRKPKLKLKDLYRTIEKLAKIVKNNSVKKEIIDFHVFVLPFHDNYLIQKINRYLLKKKLTAIINEFNFKNPIILTSSPIMECLIGEIGESSSHYFCLDDYSLFDGAFRSMEKYEKKLLDKVDSVFSVSDILKKSKIPKSGNSYFLGQGVDLEHFKMIPYSKKNRNDRPTVGFFGLISSWIDLNLIIKSANNYPQYDFVIIGPVKEDISELIKLSNVNIIGEINYNNLPLKVINFDVGIIPKKVNKLTSAMNSLKMLEYLALGLPIVSTNLPEIEKFSNYVYIGNDDEQFVSLIKVALENDNLEARISRRQLAEKYSWESITADILSNINEIEKIKIE